MVFGCFIKDLLIRVISNLTKHSSSEKMKEIKPMTVTVLTVLLITSLMALSAYATTVSTFTLSSSSAQMPIMLPKGTSFNGSILTTGTIRFWVNAPDGAQIVNLGLIDRTATFSFVAQKDGNYSLNFESGLPSSGSVQVTFSYTTNPDLPESNNSTGTPLTYLPIPIVIAVVGSILIIFFGRRRNKKQHTA